MTNERLRGRPASAVRTWSNDVQIGVRLRLDLDATAICTLFLSDTDNSTLIRQALEEFAINHGLTSSKQEVQDAIVSQAASYAAFGLVMTSQDFLTDKTPEAKLAEVQLITTPTVPRVKKLNPSIEKKPPLKDVATAVASPITVNNLLMNSGSPENSTPENQFDQSATGEKQQATDLASFGHVLLERYGGDDDY
jgi:hypothetical protein